MYGVKGKKFQRQYKNKISEFKTWKEKPHAEEWLIYPQNVSEALSIDEVALSGGELYTVVTSKKAQGKKGCLVAIVRETQSDTVIGHLQKIDRNTRLKCFPNATQVIDRFHVQKLAGEALQEIRIQHRWQAMEQENEMYSKAKTAKQPYAPELYPNGDTKKQLLARSRHLLYKSRNHWTLSQQERATILFKEYPDLDKAYQLTNTLRSIFNLRTHKALAMTKLAHWFKDVEESGFKSFNTLIKTVMVHYNEILNYFNKRSTNAAAESFNAKIKNFRTQFRGVKDKRFFLFRLANIFA